MKTMKKKTKYDTKFGSLVYNPNIKKINKTKEDYKTFNENLSIIKVLWKRILCNPLKWPIKNKAN